MQNLTYFDKNSQPLNKHFIMGLPFSAPRIFWMTMDMTSFPITNLFLKKALVAAANKEKQTLFLINEQREEILSPFNPGKTSFIPCHQAQAKSYFEQALLELGFKQRKTLPSLSLILPEKTFAPSWLKNLKKSWGKELGISCQLFSSSEKKGDTILQLAFAEWDISINDPLLTLNEFKKGTNKLKPTNNWEHPGYQTLFETAQQETNLKKREEQIIRLEQMIMEYLSILPLFYGTYAIYQK